MIRVYFVFEDPLDDEEVNLSYIDVATSNPGDAFARVERAAATGDLWRNMFPEDEGCPYRLVATKMMYLDVTNLRSEHSSETTLPG